MTILRGGTSHILSNRFPFKQTWDLLSLGRLISTNDLDIGTKWRCLKFYFNAGGIKNLYATLPRAGTHWSLLGIAIARDLAQGGSGEYDFCSDAWVPSAGAVHTKLDWREPSGMWDPTTDAAILPIAKTRSMAAAHRPGVLAQPWMFHTHLPYCRLRYAGLARLRTAVTVRNIYDSMESRFHKHQVLLRMGVFPSEIPINAIDPPSPLNEFHFPWEAALTEEIEFFNSWGDALARHRHVRHVHYEDLAADPAGAHKELSDFWRMDLPMNCLEEAFRKVSKLHMRQKLPTGNPDSTSRIAFREAGAALTAARIEFIRERLSRELIYDFGYGCEWPRRTAAA